MKCAMPGTLLLPLVKVKAPELGVNANAKGGTYRPGLGARRCEKKDETLCESRDERRQGKCTTASCLVRLIWLRRYVPYNGERS